MNILKPISMTLTAIKVAGSDMKLFGRNALGRNALATKIFSS
jgi:hypothetical protein